MKALLNRRLSPFMQYSVSITLILAINAVCFAFSDYLGYHTVALLLLMAVSFISMFFDRYPVMTAAVLSALTWNFFFIPPQYTLHINSSEDVLMFLMYFVIALMSGVVTIKIRQIEKREQIAEERKNLEKVYDRMLLSLSQRLSEPLSAVIGSAVSLQNNPDRLSAHDALEWVNEIALASRKLKLAVENLLQVSRLETGSLQMKPDWCDMHSLVHKTADRLQQSGVVQKFDIQSPQDLPYFYTDQQLVEQALFNTVLFVSANAPPDDIITVCTNCHIDHFVITVANDTPDKPNDGAKGTEGHSGENTPGKQALLLNLDIARDFVNTLNGSLDQENRFAGYTRVIMHIPSRTSYFAGNSEND